MTRLMSSVKSRFGKNEVITQGPTITVNVIDFVEVDSVGCVTVNVKL